MDGTRRRRRAWVAPVVVALLAVACATSTAPASPSDAGSTEGAQSVATSAAAVAAEENGFLAAVRPSRELIAQVAGIPVADDDALLFLGYAVCRNASQSGRSWRAIERDATRPTAGATSPEVGRARLLVVRAARRTICG
jgi:Protein of unknown function (DUF732)